MVACKEIQMKDTKSLNLLYNTPAGRSVLKLLVNPAVSKTAGVFLDSSASRLLVDSFIKKNDIDLECIMIPKGGFESFNAFFTRERKHIEFSDNPLDFCSPCDGFLSHFDIDESSCFSIKNTKYTLTEMLKSEKIASYYRGGKALIFRLTPKHYHRYHFIDDGKIIGTKKIPGVLHCVRPIATEKYPVYVQNSRELTVYKSDNFGYIAQIEVGALLVGRICNHPLDKFVKRGDEKGCFEFGGSTIVLLLQKNKIALNDETENSADEVPVILGETIGHKNEAR